MMSKKNATGLNVGSSSILIIFVLLCLMTFSILSMVSANADYKLSRKVSSRTTAYYDAVSEAQEILAAADKALESNSFEDIKGVTATYNDNEVSLDYSVPFTEAQVLHVVLSAPYPVGNKEDSHFLIRTWQVENSGTWEPDESIHLWNPEDESISH